MPNRTILTISAISLALSTLSVATSAFLASVQKRGATGDVSATWTGSNWEIPVTFGGNQPLSSILDTGSETLWVLSNLNPNVSTTPSLTPGTYYNVSKSNTMSYLNPGESMNITYIDGSGGRGPMASETVTIGGLTVLNQHIGVSNWSKPFPGGPGLIGIPRTGSHWGGSVRFDSNNSIDFSEPSFFENVVTQLSLPIWAAHLKTTTSLPSTVSFGYIDNTKYLGALTSASLLNTTMHWFVNSSSALVNGKVINNVSVRNMTMDTGAHNTAIDAAVAKEFYAAVPGATNTTNSDGSVAYFIPCNITLSQLPSLSISMGDKAGYASITAAVLPETGASRGTCKSRVQPVLSATGTLGTGFFASNYVVFDPSNNPPRVQYATST